MIALDCMKNRITLFLALIAVMLLLFSVYGISYAEDARTSMAVFYVT